MIAVKWEEFAIYLYYERKLDKSNDQSYRSKFKVLSNFFRDCEFDKLNTSRFFAEMQALGRSNETLNGYLKMLKHLTRFLDLHFLDHYTYFKKIYATHRLLSTDEVNKILNCYIERGYNKNSDKINYRFKAIFHLLCVTGCRIGELSNLKWDEVKPSFIHINAATAKVNKGRNIPIRHETFDILSKLEKYDHGYIFGDYRGPMTRPWFNTELKRRGEYLKLRDWKDLHAHQTRYFAAVNWRKAGVDIDVISKLLGHESIETTIRYYQDYPTEAMEDAVNLSPIFANRIEFSVVRNKFKKLAEFVGMTRFPLHMELNGDLIILQTQNEK